jgi:hypothetical protein
VEVITPLTRAMGPIMEVMAPIMVPQVQLQSQLATGHTMFVALATITGARITSGGQVTGRGGAVSKSGFTAITSCADTKPCRLAVSRVSALPSRHQSTRQTEGRSHEHFQKIVAPQIEAGPEDEHSQRECNRAGDRIDYKQNDRAVESKKRM